MFIFFRLLSVLTLVLSFVCHISTFIPSAGITMGRVWPMHILALAVFGAMLVSSTRKYKKKQFLPSREQSVLNSIPEINQNVKKHWSDLIRGIPVYVRRLCIIVFIYTAINFILMIANTGGDSAYKRDGNYYLENHGEIIRQLTEEEYIRYSVYVARGFSGHWILFSFLPTVYFMWIYKDDD